VNRSYIDASHVGIRVQKLDFLRLFDFVGIGGTSDLEGHTLQFRGVRNDDYCPVLRSRKTHMAVLSDNNIKILAHDTLIDQDIYIYAPTTPRV
jgi:hypothetical protein